MGENFHELLEYMIFTNKNFADYLLVQPTDTTPPKFSKARVPGLLLYVCLL